MTKGKLNIYKASAGSGKTHTLTHKYISFLLSDNAGKDAYKHILAVTFTNKATEEMKSRIVKTLYDLSKGDGDELEGLSGPDAAKVIARSKEALISILHDYSNFQVSTIDKFFQQIFRSFARELGSFSNYRVELRDDEVLAHVIDEMLSQLDNESDPANAAIFEVLNTFALGQLRYQSKPRYEAQLLSFAQLFIKEDFKMKSAEYSADYQTIGSVEEAARQAVESFEQSSRTMAREALTAIAEQGLKPDDFLSGSRSAMVQVGKYAEGQIKLPGSALAKMASTGPDEWFAKKSADLVPLARAACNRAGDKQGLDALVKGIYDLYDSGYTDYVTAKIVRDNVGAMKIFGSIYDALGKYLKENNIMLLGETAQALNRMIGDSDTPFIYERIGSWIDSFLLDEFQDFSLMQWANFKPLLEQSLDSGYEDLIVGDVKQSIYRWRGSDWNTLDSGVQSQMQGRSMVVRPLDTNYRSDRAIVEFNNELFSTLVDPAKGCFDGDETIARAFSDCKQKIHSSAEGHVKLSFLPSDGDFTSLDALKGEIETLDQKGYQRSDIYILVRKNDQAAMVAERLIADGIGVITDESLVVGGSTFVQQMIAVLKYIVNSGDKVNLQLIQEIGIDVENLDTSGNSLYDVCENIIRSLDKTVLEGEMPYLTTFMDLVLEYMRDYGSDMAGFLRWWDDVGKTQTISAPKGANAVRVMTIHKAKGLGCPAVIVPFFHEDLSIRRGNYIWCEDTSFLNAGLLPVECLKELQNSRFASDYERESLFVKMDAINTAYVAFTRAKHELIIFAKDKNHNPGISDKVYALLTAAGKLSDGVYESGSGSECKTEDGDEADMGRIQLSEYNSIPMEGTSEGRKRLALVYRGSEFFEDGQTRSPRARGIVLHDILSAINSAEDISSAIEAAVASGELANEERADTEKLISDMVASAAAYGWFAEGAQVLNELSIINTDGKVYRPDRVISFPDRTVVVDYKFGAHHSGYRSQVRRYMDMLCRMGYAGVEGYLWYAAENNVEKVD